MSKKLTLKLKYPIENLPDSVESVAIIDVPKADSVSQTATHQNILEINKQPESQSPKTKNDKPTGPLKAKPKFLMEKKQFEEILHFLQDSYPKCFNKPPVPLSIGIHQDLFSLQHQKLSKTIIRKFLTIYCKRADYRNCLVVGTDRINLAGIVSSIVTEEQISKKV